MRTDQGVVNPDEDVCIHFDKPECSFSSADMKKLKIKDYMSRSLPRKMLIFLEIVFPNAKKKLFEWYIPNPL